MFVSGFWGPEMKRGRSYLTGPPLTVGTRHHEVHAISMYEADARGVYVGGR